MTAGGSTRYGFFGAIKIKNKIRGRFWLNEKRLALGAVLLRQESKGAAALTRLTWLPLGRLADFSYV